MPEYAILFDTIEHVNDEGRSKLITNAYAIVKAKNKVEVVRIIVAHETKQYKGVIKKIHSIIKQPDETVGTYLNGRPRTIQYLDPPEVADA